MIKGDGWNRASFTTAEKATANIAKVITQLYSLYMRPNRSQEKAAQDIVGQSLEGLYAWLVQCSENLTSSTASGEFASILIAPTLTTPLWSLYHELFSYIEQCRFIRAAVEYILAENKKLTYVNQKSLSDQMEALRSACTELENSVRTSASAVQQRLRIPSFVHQLTETVLGNSKEDSDEATVIKAIKNLGNQLEMERTCHDLKDSWVEGLGAVVLAKLASE